MHRENLGDDHVHDADHEHSEVKHEEVHSEIAASQRPRDVFYEDRTDDAFGGLGYVLGLILLLVLAALVFFFFLGNPFQNRGTVNQPAVTPNPTTSTPR